MTEVYFDPKSGLFRCGDPRKLTPQQRANWQLMQAVLESEYDRGFRRGLIQGQSEAAVTAYNEFLAAMKEHGSDLELFLDAVRPQKSLDNSGGVR